MRDQQLLAVIHVVLAGPRFIFLDRADAALDGEKVREILNMLTARSITYINNGAADEAHDLYDAVLEAREDGGWTWTANIPREISGS